MAEIYRHKDNRGRLIEYRRHPFDTNILFIQHRELKADGTPHDDRWYPVSDSHLLALQQQDRGCTIVDALAAETPDSLAGPAKEGG